TFHGLPPRLHQTVMRRVRSRCPEALDLLRAGSVLGGSFRVDELAAVLERSPASLHPVLLDAIDARLLDQDGDRLRFRHDLIREAVYRDTPEPIRASLHRLAATALAARSQPSPVVAGHLLAGGVDAHAVGQLRRAAAALAGSDPVAALAMIDRALEAPGVDPSVRQELALERVR